MAKKYNFSVTYPVGDGITETLQVVEGDSFDEVIRIVEKAVKERMETVSARVNKPAAQVAPVGSKPDMAKTFSDPAMQHEVPNNVPTTQNSGPAKPPESRTSA